MQGVTVADHPLIQHKLSLIREKDRSSKTFRELLRELGMLLCYEVTRDLPLVDAEIETPLARTVTKRIAGKKLVHRTDLARRPKRCRRDARSGSDGARRAYRSLSRAGNVHRHRILLQGARRSRRAIGDRRRAGPRDRQHGRGRREPDSRNAAHTTSGWSV